MFLKRLQEEGEEEEEEEEAGLLNLLFLTLVSFPGWKKKKRDGFIKPPLSVVT